MKDSSVSVTVVTLIAYVLNPQPVNIDIESLVKQGFQNRLYKTYILEITKKDAN